MPQPPTIVHRNDDHLIARFDTVTFCIWKKKTTLLGIQKCCESYKEAATGNRPAAAFGIIFENCEIPKPDVRQAIVESFDNPAHNLKAVLAVIEGKGLTFTAKRAALMGMSVVTQKNVIVHTFSNVAEGAQYVESRLKTKSRLELLQVGEALLEQARSGS